MVFWSDNFSVIHLGATTFSIMTLSTTTLSIKGLFATLSTSELYFKSYNADFNCTVSRLSVTVHNVIILTAVMMNVTAPVSGG